MEIELIVDPLLPPVLGDRVLFRQVIINLVMNASQTMTKPDSPRVLRITTSPGGPDDDVVVLDSSTPTLVSLSEDAEKLFTAFHATQADGYGAFH